VLADIEDSTFKDLLFCLLPNGDTLLHMIARRFKIVGEVLERAKNLNIFFPFVQNSTGETPMHICLKSGQINTANLFLQHLALMPFDHHSRAISSCLPDLISKQLPWMDEYLQSRLQETPLIENAKIGTLIG